MDVRPPQYGPGSASAAGPAQPGLVRVPGPLSGPCQSVSQSASQPGPVGVSRPRWPCQPCVGLGRGGLLARGGEGRAGGFGELGLQAGTWGASRGVCASVRGCECLGCPRPERPGFEVVWLVPDIASLGAYFGKRENKLSDGQAYLKQTGHKRSGWSNIAATGRARCSLTSWPRLPSPLWHWCTP